MGQAVLYEEVTGCLGDALIADYVGSPDTNRAMNIFRQGFNYLQIIF